uniref:Uncharacterized protein n=1 Tax=Rangifer tarandus platyrhynchus TaxID=3082113 RepID=A0ACB0E5M8_RANTA|nr:unnamed protein product [Rangifer tarandus platyrhynchus]
MSQAGFCSHNAARTPFRASHENICGKDLIWWWPNTDQDGLPQRGPEEHAVWKLSGDVLIMRAILVGFNYVKSGARGRRDSSLESRIRPTSPTGRSGIRCVQGAEPGFAGSQHNCSPLQEKQADLRRDQN